MQNLNYFLHARQQPATVQLCGLSSWPAKDAKQLLVIVIIVMVVFVVAVVVVDAVFCCHSLRKLCFGSDLFAIRFTCWLSAFILLAVNIAGNASVIHE